MKPTTGGSRDGCTGTRQSAIEHFCMESEAYKICEGGQPKKEMQLEGMTSEKFIFVQVIKACTCLGAFQDMAGLFINNSFKVVVSLMSLRAVAWLTCM
jgi:hypothetical protein